MLRQVYTLDTMISAACSILETIIVPEPNAANRFRHSTTPQTTTEEGPESIRAFVSTVHNLQAPVVRPRDERLEHLGHVGEGLEGNRVTQGKVGALAAAQEPTSPT